MPTIKVIAKGDYSKALAFLEKCLKAMKLGIFDKYGQMGVDALAAATPKRTGTTAGSWTYSVGGGASGPVITWDNTNVNNGFKVAVGLQMGHGTGTGGYVTGIDYINPAMRPVFERIAKDLIQEVLAL